MQICESIDAFAAPPTGVVLTIGNFDGVHLGHRAIIAAAQRTAAAQGVEAVVITFDPHPLTILAPERAPEPLSTTPEKLALLAELGAATCILQPVDRTFLARTADDFLLWLLERCRPKAFVEGPDFTFGRRRGGDIDTLRAAGTQWGFEVQVVGAVHCETLPTAPTISSTSIRQALRDGRIAEAAALLGRPYRIVGVVEGGDGRGAALGFPTANIGAILHLLPQEAVYAGVAQLESGALHAAAVNIGAQPTFDQAGPRVEAHLLDFTGNLYGQRVGLHLLARLRAQERFEGIEALVRQIEADVAAVRHQVPPGVVPGGRAIPL